MICVSCQHEHDENFCPNCGERNGIKKITLASLIEDSLTSLTDMDKGFLFNIKSLISKPQKIAEGYISGKRKGILNPISFLIVSISIYLIVIAIFKIPKDLSEINRIPETTYEKLGYVLGKFIRGNLKFFWIFSIVPLGLSLKLIFKRFNYWEHLAIGSFVIGQATLIAIVSYLVFRFPLIFDPVVYLAILWLIFKIYKDENNKKDIYILSFSALFLFIILLILIIITR